MLQLDLLHWEGIELGGKRDRPSGSSRLLNGPTQFWNPYLSARLKCSSESENQADDGTKHR